MDWSLWLIRLHKEDIFLFSVQKCQIRMNGATRTNWLQRCFKITHEFFLAFYCVSCKEIWEKVKKLFRVLYLRKRLQNHTRQTEVYDWQDYTRRTFFCFLFKNVKSGWMVLRGQIGSKGVLKLHTSFFLAFYCVSCKEIWEKVKKLFHVLYLRKRLQNHTWWTEVYDW